MISMAMLHDAQRVLKPVINQTPVIPTKGLVPGCAFYLKADCLQKTGAFKLRGAYYKIATLSDEEKARGVIACSAGNHAQGVAYAAKAAGVAAISDEAYFADVTAKVIAERTRTTAELRRRGFTVFDSSTNFLFAATDRMPCREIFEKLRDRGILIRHFNAPRISGYLRITIGTPDQMQRFLTALDEILEG